MTAPLHPVLRRGMRVSVKGWSTERRSGVITRVERNVYGTEPGFAVREHDGTHLVHHASHLDPVGRAR